MGRLSGKVAIISGAASGIGRASAKLFAAEGASVVATDLAAGVEETVREIHAAGGKAVYLIGDAGHEDDVADWVETARSEFGGLDIAWANAGLLTGALGVRPFLEQMPEDWAQLLRVNLIGPFLMIKHAAPLMAAGGKGSIILTASVAGLRSGAGPAPYAASKAGVINLAQTACQELAGSGVRVNAICPGLIETGMTRPLYEHARARGSEGKIGKINPLQRGGEPLEIANAALFIASDESSYVNGQAIIVDGGLSSSHPVVAQKPGGARAF